MSIDVIRADYTDPRHATAIIDLLDAYARDPMGGNHPLSAAVREGLVPALAARSDAVSILAFVDGVPAGLVNMFEGFSTFKCKPLMNIHDVTVLADFRGLGLARRMLAMAEAIAIERGCCKLTLEVLDGNHTAKALYHSLGFAGYALDPATGQAVFWEKPVQA
ncbi:GNAT family N-acetyltransferase [Brevundimonas sp.]|uniref:GNAT family N-acetyltransferase n=1 Tax=Brevundimonas sp. TaxID=1871086 RepID=UPI002487A100|nr:GNAT family N-acetyltransferase [Brevundimonas sp.]MDI1282523.1 GNAT family N-acetyltransferase [Brevundimonas sp.]